MFLLGFFIGSICGMFITGMLTAAKVGEGEKDNDDESSSKIEL